MSIEPLLVSEEYQAGLYLIKSFVRRYRYRQISSRGMHTIVRRNVHDISDTRLHQYGKLMPIFNS